MTASNKTKVTKSKVAVVEAAVLDKMNKLLPKLVHQVVGAKAARTEERKVGELKLPKEGGVCRVVWDHLDMVGKSATLSTADEIAEAEKVSPATARTQFYRWKQYRSAHPIRRSRKAAH